MEDKIDKLIRLESENNKMLRYIIRYINYIESQAPQENVDDFGRNVIANLISGRLKR